MANSCETVGAPGKPRFDTTVWGRVMLAAHRSSPDGRAAFAELCQAYWYPLYAYVRSRGHDVHEAEDLTQGFFAKVVEKNYVGDADPNRGKFRTFLLSSLNHYLANEHDRRSAKKRGGDRLQVSLGADEAERRFSLEPVWSDDAERQFEQRWARCLLDRVLDRLRRHYVDSGQGARFDELRSFLTTEPDDSTAEIAQRLHASESAVRVAVHRMRLTYRKHLREEIASTLGSVDDIDGEIASLRRVFGQSRRFSSNARP